MGGCCSCHRMMRTTEFDAYPVVVGEEEEEEPVDDEDIVLNGNAGARIYLQGSSNYVSMFSRKGQKGVNQDAMTVWENFSGDKDMFFCAVFDGHGPSGHEVARYARDLLPAVLSSCSQTGNDPKDAVLEIETSAEEAAEKIPELTNPVLLSWKARLNKGFHFTDEHLEREISIETYCSGTTSVCVVKKGEHLIIANLGDSRAVLCKRDENNGLVSEQLTVDLKPNLPEEAERIRSCEGRVLAMEGEPNLYRVWMPHEDCPGLAMARAFGDFCIKDFGLISTPVVTYRKLTERDEFVVLATDGVWNALSNDQVVQTVASAKRRSMAAKLVVHHTSKAWRCKFPRAKRDDCTAVCLFFKGRKTF